MKNKQVKQMMKGVHGIVFGRSIHSVMHGINKNQVFLKNDSKWRLKFDLTISLTAEQLKK